MTVETTELFELIYNSGFRQKGYRVKGACYIMDYRNPYNIRSDYRGYRFRQFYIELDFEFFKIFRGSKVILSCLLSERPGWGNDEPVNYLHIPEEIIYFIINKEFKPVPPKPNRKDRYISKKLRQLIFSLFNNSCNFCGSNEHLEIDHIFPFSKGGKSEKNNLQLLCKPCNRKKHNKLPV